MFRHRWKRSISLSLSLSLSRSLFLVAVYVAVRIEHGPSRASCERHLIAGIPRQLCVRRSADDPGEAAVPAREGGRNSELLLHRGGRAIAADTLEEERQEDLA